MATRAGETAQRVSMCKHGDQCLDPLNLRGSQVLPTVHACGPPGQLDRNKESRGLTSHPEWLKMRGLGTLKDPVFYVAEDGLAGYQWKEKLLLLHWVDPQCRGLSGGWYGIVDREGNTFVEEGWGVRIGSL